MGLCSCENAERSKIRMRLVVNLSILGLDLVCFIYLVCGEISDKIYHDEDRVEKPDN